MSAGTPALGAPGLGDARCPLPKSSHLTHRGDLTVTAGLHLCPRLVVSPSPHTEELEVAAGPPLPTAGKGLLEAPLVQPCSGRASCSHSHPP